jgi:hypothetical protein
MDDDKIIVIQEHQTVMALYEVDSLRAAAHRFHPQSDQGKHRQLGGTTLSVRKHVFSLYSINNRIK